MTYTFTLAQARTHDPCADGWRIALTAHGPDLDRPLTLADIARSNSAADALWCLRLLDWSNIDLRRQVLRGVLLPACRRAHAAASPGTPEPKYLVSLGLWADGDDSVDLGEAERAAWVAEAWAAEAGAAWAAGVGAEWAVEAVAMGAKWAAEREVQRADIIRTFGAQS
jgi:hypothetical protein